MHKSLDVFEFKPGQTTDYGVTCPWISLTMECGIGGRDFLFIVLLIRGLPK